MLRHARHEGLTPSLLIPSLSRDEGRGPGRAGRNRLRNAPVGGTMARAEETLVLVPGLVCDDAVWHHARDHLGEIAGCVVVPADEADTIQGLAGAILGAVSGRFALAGFSMGGYIAL